ncbi:MAG TPA: hypothetical protein VK589_04645 [Chryseolinea sp.]|nr:hypothetical protein [Chryseolinea sp.]
MPWFRGLLWIGTIILMVVLGMKCYHLRSAQVATVEAFEFANKQEAPAIIRSWEDKKVMYTVKSSIWLDYAFLVFYVLLMINCSNHQMNREQNRVLNNLLRLNIPLAVASGALDFAENSIMLHNIRSIEDYFPTALISTLKFALAGWIVVVWIFAVIKRRVVLGRP